MLFAALEPRTMDDNRLEIPSCFDEVFSPRGYFCKLCKCTITASPDNSTSRTIQKLKRHIASKSHMSSVSNRKISPFLQSGSKTPFPSQKPDLGSINLDEDVGEFSVEQAELLECEVDLVEDDAFDQDRVDSHYMVDSTTQIDVNLMVDAQTQVDVHTKVDVQTQVESSVDNAYCQTEVESILVSLWWMLKITFIVL